ncbi:MAG TPA: sulfate ABC transporter substrate-binding protein [Verrucomicrobiae bacterium]
MRILGVIAAIAALSSGSFAADKNTLLNVSYDVAREFYEKYNALFIEDYKKKTGRTIKVNQSHAGSTKQARAVVDGLEADVVTMNQTTDVDFVAERGRNLMSKDWRKKFPHNASPYTSTMAIMVRKGNPKGIKDWDDLAKPGISVVIPNPKTAGNGRYSYLAMWAFAKEKFGGDEAQIKKLLTGIFKNVPVLDTGGRGATTTFVLRGIGDALLTFEAEIHTTIQEAGADKFEIVYPSQSVEAEMPIAIVERVVDRHGTRELATDYLNFLYSEPAQELIAKHFYRPRLEAVAQKHADRFGKLKLVKVDEAFGSWGNAQKVHFSDGGTFDQIFAARNK